MLLEDENQFRVCELVVESRFILAKPTFFPGAAASAKMQVKSNL
jgi:hypothetical protein